AVATRTHKSSTTCCRRSGWPCSAPPNALRFLRRIVYTPAPRTAAVVVGCQRGRKQMADPTTTTVIGADTHIKGDMSFDSTARILGTFEGKITSKGELQVANGATCRASVEASKVLVDGEVDGNLAA